MDGCVAVRYGGIFIESVQAIQQRLFHADIAEGKALDVVQTVRFYGFFDRGNSRLVFFAKFHIPSEIKLQAETVRFSVFHQAFFVQKPANVSGIERAVILSVTFNSGSVNGGVLPDVVFGKTILFGVAL